ncbi:MAG TPA: hypothetical protein VLO11_11260 [Luteolibacter sp.]|nr:hypothetical protein [Luteolibacter sp.]
MVHTFATREEAAIFASAMRAEGYYADILDEGMGSIYGPLAIGGIRVIVSEESAENDGDDSYTVPSPPAESDDGELLTTLRLFVVGLVACGLVVLVIALLAAFANQPGGLLWELIRLLKYPLVIGLAFAAMGPSMIGFTRWLRDERTYAGSGWLRWLLLVVILTMLLPTVWSWCVGGYP